ncbi:MAG: AtpZ/AtpI family protein [Clostridia bacterium]|nr:AtpZ/AtpI family protein [Clostridia bacterium]
MKKIIVSTVFGINSVIQAIFSLLTPVAVAVLVSMLLTKKFGVGTWIYAVLIVLGVFVGLVSMVKYLLAMAEAEKARQKELEEGLENGPGEAHEKGLEKEFEDGGEQ